VTTNPGCFWQASLAGSFVNPFISLIEPSSGAGNGSFQFSMQQNTTNFPRTGSIRIAGQLVQILQHGTNVLQLFDDVPPTHTFFDYSILMNRFGIYSGCGNSQYCVDTITTRGKMAELVIKSKLGDNFTPIATPFFTDVPVTHPQFKYIQKMKELGIT